MRRRDLWMAAALAGSMAAALTGCTPAPSPEAGKPNPLPPESEMAGRSPSPGAAPSAPGSAPSAGTKPGAEPGAKPGTPAPAPREPAPKTKEEIAARLERLSKAAVPREALAIAPPDADGWSQSRLSPQVLGSRMDKAFASLKPAYVDGRITFETAEGTQVGKPRLRVGEKGRFHLEYFDPSVPGRLLRHISDGVTVASYDGKKWTRAKKKAGGTLTPADAGKWGQEFPRLMLTPMTEGRKVWQPLFTVWSEMSSSRLILQERTMKSGGQERTLYRALLQSQGGPERKQEILVDSTLWLPVTIRSQSAGTSGKKESLMWTGKWAFGGSHGADTFELPVQSNGPSKGS